MHKARYSTLLTVALVGGSVLPGTAAAIGRHPTVDQPPGVSTSALTPEQAARARPMLREGVRGPAVVYVQQRLEVTPRSGYFGPLTRAAVQAFQRQNDLRATGRVTEVVWVALLGQSPDVAAEARPRLEQGMRGPAVVYVQQRLDVTPTSGYFGPLTSAAVQAFQRRHDLNPTGRVTKNVWRALLAPVTQDLTPEEAAQTRPRLNKGTRGPAVAFVQQRLDVTPVSGYYGRLTRNAVKKFQRQHQLNPTGRVTKNVWTALLAPRLQDMTPEQAAATRPPLYRSLGPGHPAVVFVQRYLNVTPDSGFYGTLTTAAVTAYQRGLSLRVTGRVNPSTWNAILAERRVPGAIPPSAPSKPLPRGTGLADRALAYALAQVGKRYVLGGNGPDVFDCSGLVQQAYLRVGISLPRLASQQRFAGTNVSLRDLRPGDLLYYQDGPSPRSGHISMYAGDGMAVEAANPRRGVRMRGLNEPWYRDRFVAATRVA